MEDFAIQIEDGSYVLPEIVREENIKTAELYNWQRRAIKFFFENNNNAIFQVSTGSGKTICAIEIIKKVIEQNPNIRVLIVVPKNIILETTWFKELYERGFNIKDIGVYYGNIKEYAKITITNMQNIHKIVLEAFDMIIFDEIHNYGTKRLLPFLERDFKYKLGLSATLERMDKKHYEIIKIFNYNVFEYSPKEALIDGVLNPFDFTNISVEMDEENKEKYNTITASINMLFASFGGYNNISKIGGGVRLKLLGLLNERKDLVNNYTRKLDVIKLIVEKNKTDKYIIFNQFNKQTSKTYWYLLDVGVRTCVVHSGLPNDVREQNLTDFKNDKYNVMLASKVLDEGWNLPKVDTAIISAGDSTSRQTIQRMGRVLRKKNKTSKLIQLYCKNTIEETYANKRSLLFKELCSNYYYYDFNINTVNINW